jgi:hypothetical protein
VPKPKRLRACEIPEVLKPEVDRLIREMLELDIIKPSISETASPVVCVYCKDLMVRTGSG